MEKDKLDHPYKREYLEAPIRMHKYKLECLHKRMELMPPGTNDYERNEVALEKMRTSTEIKALTNIIAERESYYLHYFNNVFLKDLEDMEENMSDIINKANNSKVSEIKDLCEKLKFNVKGSVNIELKIHLYKLLKNKLNEN